MLEKKEAGPIDGYLCRVRALAKEIDESLQTCIGVGNQLGVGNQFDVILTKNIDDLKSTLLSKTPSLLAAQQQESLIKEFNVKRQDSYFDFMGQNKDLSFKLFSKFNTELRLFSATAQARLVAILRPKGESSDLFSKLREPAAKVTDESVLELFTKLKECYQLVDKISSAIQNRMGALFAVPDTKSVSPEFSEFLAKSRDVNHHDSAEYKLFKTITEVSKNRKAMMNMRQFLENSSESAHLSEDLLKALKPLVKEIEDINSNTFKCNETSIQWIEQNRKQPCEQVQQGVTFMNKSM